MRRFVVSLALLAHSAAFVLAGPITPPPGPVASTHKTLTEIEPRIAINATNTPGDGDSLYKITQPGSYYLTGNITGVVGKHGIEIAASGVTLDLNGFDLVGVTGMGAFDGVNSLGIGFTNITVMNGSIRNWGGDGLELATVGQQICRVQGVLASGNAGRGIAISSGSVAACSALSNTGVGIEIGTAASVSGCVARANNGGGFLSADATSFVDCTAFQNQGAGFSCANACTFMRCISRGNLGSGFFGAAGCTLNDCSASANGGDGIRFTDASSITHCTTLQNSLSGFKVDSAATLAHCTARLNSLDGIVAANICVITECSVSENNRRGIDVNFSSTITGCAALANREDGIRTSSYCFILNNLTRANGAIADGAGVRVTGNANRIEGNNMVQDGHVLDVGGDDNFIIRNTGQSLFGNDTRWFIVAGNAYGPIHRTSVGAAVNGISAPTSPLNSTDPNANFSY